MFYSGLILTTAPEHLNDLTEKIELLDHVEMHHCDPSSGKLILVIEAEDIDTETDLFRTLRDLPHVLDLSLVIHREEQDPAAL